MIEHQFLKTIIKDWSFWLTPPVSGLTREVQLPSQLHPDLVLIIQGVRRGGKSTLLMQFPERYQLPLPQCYYCNFEDPRLMNDLDHRLLSRVVELARKDFSYDTPCYFFFDEIQNVDGWEKWLHTQLERSRFNYFIITGSNSRLLSGEFGTALTGRHITIELFPFSWPEFQSLCPEKTFEDYLITGGFPRPILYEHPHQLLQEYFNDIILRDVLKRVRARSPEAIKQVAKMTFDACGSELSFRKIAAVTDLTVDTVKTYLEACEQAYLLFSCPYFAFSEKKQISPKKKYYPVDPGLRYAVTNTRGRDLGKSLEILVYLRLKQTHERVFYWQETHQGEVDFVTLQGNVITPYQVTWDNPLERHEKALSAFYAAYPTAEEVIFITRETVEQFL